MYKLKNYMEDVVIHKTDEIIKILNICTCDKCRYDIIAIALNNLPSRYVVTEVGELYTKVNELKQQFEIDIETQVIKAALFVGKNPKHN